MSNYYTETHELPAGPKKLHSIDRVTNHVERTSSIPQRSGVEYYDTLLWRIKSRYEGTAAAAGYLVGLTSCERKAGVSTVAANLAIRAAEHEMGLVLLADFNFRNPALHSLLRAKCRGGLSEVLTGKATLDDCIQTTSIAGLHFLPLGAPDRRNRICATLDQVDTIVAQMREQYALVVCDLPAAGHLGPALMFAAKLDAGLLVLRSGKATQHDAQHAAHSLAADGVPLVGTVLTDLRSGLPKWLERLV